MLRLSIPQPLDKPLNILCLGAHADDIEIGCGGTILTLLASRAVRVRWVVFSAAEEREAEATGSATRFLSTATESSVQTHAFRDGYLPYLRGPVKDEFAAIAATYAHCGGPDVIFTHDEQDLHQDHALLGALTRETFRDHLILGYEIPKKDGGLHSPNVLMPLSEAAVHEKVGLLMGGFPSQLAKPWFTPELFLGLMRLRGMESGAATGYAEGFHARRVVLDG
ncbi:MAG: PIG-L family deacetylase [Gemmatimonadales bacterium]|nr:MAG: PIG-L family deacetylase [Gemmatimonadales bacterium]